MRAVHHRGQWYVRAMCSGRWNFGAIFEFWIWILDLNFQNSNMAPHQQCVVDNLIFVCHDTVMCVCAISFHVCVCVCELMRVGSFHMCARGREVGGWGRVPFSRNLMSPTPRRKWYLTTGRRFHSIVLDPIPQSLPVHFFGSRPQPPTSPRSCVCVLYEFMCVCACWMMCVGFFRMCAKWCVLCKSCVLNCYVNDVCYYVNDVCWILSYVC